MNQRKNLTVLIPAGNEENNLEDCIESARFADCVMVVVDASSTDNTENIARQNADEVLVHEYENSAAQKNWALQHVKTPWVLVVDSDERVTPELQKDIEEVLESDDPADGYRIYRKNHFAGREIQGCGWQRDDVLRLFRTEYGIYETKNVHADVIFPELKNPRIEHLGGKLLHFTFESFSQYLRKHSRYAQWAGGDRVKGTEKVTLNHLALRPLWRFFRQYVLYKGYRDGIPGFVICWMAAHSVFLKYAHAWEIKEQERKEANRRAQ